jgi:hypothetical protein
MCIEAAITQALGLEFNDEPECVEPVIRTYKIQLNDKYWPTTKDRAEGLRDLGIAQIGSRGIVDGRVFVKRLAESTIRVLLPALIRETPRLTKIKGIHDLADRCEREGSQEAARALRERLYADAAAAYAAADAADAAAYAAAAYAAAAYAADADAYAAADAADAADAAAYAAAAYAAAAYAADAAAYAAADAADAADAAAYAAADAYGNKARLRFLRLSASLALEILIDMKSPGAEWISENAVEKLRTISSVGVA